MKKHNSRDNQIAGLVFSLPLIIGLIIFLIPTVYLGIRFAFSNVDVSNGLLLTGNGIFNFKYALTVDPNYFPLAIADLRSLVTTLPVIIVFSLFVAVLLNSSVWGRGVFRAIFFLPVIACVGMLADMRSEMVMQTMNSAAQDSGIDAFSAISDVSLMLQRLNFSPELINAVSGAANNIFEIVNRSGVQILIFLAGIQSISPSIYESANVEGASSWELFWKITLPMLSPMIIVNVLFTFVDCITRDNTKLMVYIKNVAFGKGEFGYSAAMAWFHYLMLLTMLAIICGIWLLVRRKTARGEAA